MLSSSCTMHHNFLLRLFVILLGFSYVLYVSAIPATRSRTLNKQEDASLIPLTQIQGALKLENGEEMLEEGLMERRMDFETQDYGGTGANKDHDPKTPGNG